MKSMKLAHGEVRFPAFFPDATYAAVRAADAIDAENAHCDGLVMNAYHLMLKPGAGLIKSAGGLHRFTGWNGPILTDSGGYQVFSLIGKDAKFGEIRNDGIIFRPDGGEKMLLSPEKCIQAQFAYGSDIMITLDYCIDADADTATATAAVDATIRWAKMCKETYDHLLAGRKSDMLRPLLFGVIQGGNDRELRKRCADALIEIGFDGFGFGGWPLSEGKLCDDMLAYTASLMPDALPKYLLGVGKPEEIVRCTDMGYDLFDCIIPTREARGGKLYAFDASTIDDIVLSPKADFYDSVYIIDDKYARDHRPVSDVCDCPVCKRYSRSYLRHLFKLGDASAHRLATIHNLRFYSMLMEKLRGA
ncbi:MAG: tRNA guanosine(34) transglycosylase Tgt [Spirochaetes bacterium]|nr:tRNA guanosine(34) transglycosylase Tgt [Spirochaetota bacterium]